MASEQWRPVVGYEGWYEVSDHGRVKRVRKGHRTRVGFILRPKIAHGYEQVGLTRDAVQRWFSVHRLMMAAFVGPCPAGKEVNHKNGVKADNRLCNLEYVTHKENMRHAVKVKGVGRWNIKLTERVVRAIRRRYEHCGAVPLNYAEVGREYGVQGATIKSVVLRRTWAHVA